MMWSYCKFGSIITTLKYFMLLSPVMYNSRTDMRPVTIVPTLPPLVFVMRLLHFLVLDSASGIVLTQRKSHRFPV